MRPGREVGQLTTGSWFSRDATTIHDELGMFRWSEKAGWDTPFLNSVKILHLTLIATKITLVYPYKPWTVNNYLAVQYLGYIYFWAYSLQITTRYKYNIYKNPYLLVTYGYLKYHPPFPDYPQRICHVCHTASRGSFWPCMWYTYRTSEQTSYASIDRMVKPVKCLIRCIVEGFQFTQTTKSWLNCLYLGKIWFGSKDKGIVLKQSLPCCIPRRRWWLLTHPLQWHICKDKV